MSFLDHDDEDRLRHKNENALRAAEAKARSSASAPAAPEEPMLRWFAYAHLPEKLQAVSKIFHGAAHATVAAVAASDERTQALRKLLEAKDAAVRAALS